MGSSSSATWDFLVSAVVRHFLVESHVVSCRPESATIAEHCSVLREVAAELQACGEYVAVLKVPNS